MTRKLMLAMVISLVPILVVVSACGGGGAAPTAAPAAAPTKAPAAAPTTAPAAAPTTAATSVATKAPPATPTAASAPAATAAPGAAASTGDIAAGKAVFDQNCNSCHPGGDRGAGPALKGKNLPADRIKNQVRHGGGGMPAFSTSQISDAQLDNLVAYVQSLK